MFSRTARFSGAFSRPCAAAATPTHATTQHALRAVTVALALMSAAPVAFAQGSMSPPPAAPTPQMSGHSKADSAQSLVNFITTVSRDEVAAAKVALQKTSSAEIKAYAQQSIEDHENVLTAWAQKVPSLSLSIPDSAKLVTRTPQAAAGSAAMANGISEVRDTATAARGGVGAAALHSANVALLAKLREMNGAQFDKAFVDAEAEGLDATLKELEKYPVTYTELQTLLTQFKDIVYKHRTTARKLQGAS